MSKIEYREVPVTTYRTVRVRKYPEILNSSVNKRILEVVVNYFEKGIETSSIKGFNFEYKDNEVWVYQWADEPGEGSMLIVKKEKSGE